MTSKSATCYHYLNAWELVLPTQKDEGYSIVSWSYRYSLLFPDVIVASVRNATIRPLGSSYCLHWKLKANWSKAKVTEVTSVGMISVTILGQGRRFFFFFFFWPVCISVGSVARCNVCRIQFSSAVELTQRHTHTVGALARNCEMRSRSKWPINRRITIQRGSLFVKKG